MNQAIFDNSNAPGAAQAKGAAQPLRISCLHTHHQAIKPYEDACPDGVHLTHYLKPEFRIRAEQSPPAAVQAEFQALCDRLKRVTDRVLVTCPSLSRLMLDDCLLDTSLLAHWLTEHHAGSTAEVIFVDPMAESALTKRFEFNGAPPRTRLNWRENAWEAAGAGNWKQCLEAVRQAAATSDADVVVLPEAFLAPVAQRLDRPVLSSPQIVLSHLCAQHGEG